MPRPADLSLVVTAGMRLTLIGVAIGTALSIALGRWLQFLLSASRQPIR